MATVTFIISDYCFLKVMKTCNHIPFASFFSVYYCLLFIQLSNDTEHWSVKKFALKLYSIFIHLQSFIGHLCLSANDILKLCCNGEYCTENHFQYYSATSQCIYISLWTVLGCQVCWLWLRLMQYIFFTFTFNLLTEMCSVHASLVSPFSITYSRLFFLLQNIAAK